MTTSFCSRHHAALLAALACAACPGPAPNPAPPAARPPATPTSEPHVDGHQLAPEGPWEAAGAGDTLSELSLTELHPAPDLMAVARHDPERRRAALGALGRAQDAMLVVGELAELAQARPELRSALLDALVAIARQPPPQTEPLDPPSLGRCLAALRALSASSTVDDADRARADSALRAFARAGYLDPDSLPAGGD